MLLVDSKKVDSQKIVEHLWKIINVFIASADVEVDDNCNLSPRATGLPPYEKNSVFESLALSGSEQ